MSERAEKIAENEKQIEVLKQKMAKLRNVDELTNVVKDASGDVAAAGSIAYKSRKTLVGHFGKIYALDWGKNPNTLASAAQDGSLILWQAKTKQKLNVITLRSSWVMSCAMSKSGSMVGCGGLDNILTIFKVPDNLEAFEGDIPEYKELNEHSGYLADAAFFDDDSQVISASGDGTALLWDMKTSKFTATFSGHGGDITACKLIGDGNNTFVTCSSDKTCRLWDARDAKSGGLIFPGHTSDINGLDVSSSGNYFVSAASDAKIVMHDIRSFGPVQTYQNEEHDQPFTSVCFSNSQRMIYTGSDDFNCHVFDSLSSDYLAGLSSHTGRVACVGINSAGTALATGSWDHNVQIWA